MFSINSTDISLIAGLKAVGGASDATGLTLTDLTVEVARADGTVTSSVASALGTTDAAHTDYGMFEKSAGLFRVDVPDSIFTSAGESYVKISGAAVETAILKVAVGNQVPSETLNDYKADLATLNDISIADIQAGLNDVSVAEIQAGLNDLSLAEIQAGLNDVSVADVIAGLNAESYDGSNFGELMEALRALVLGNFTVAGTGSGNLTVTLYKANGSTVLKSFSVSETTGARTGV